MSNKNEKQQTLVEVAKEVLNQKGVEVTAEHSNVKKVKTFSDVNDKIDFHPELDKVDFDDVQGLLIKVIDAKLIRDFDSQFGKHDFMIVHASDANHPEQSDFTFGTSGVVLIKRIMTAQEKRQLPLVGTINKPEGKAYYDIN